MLFIKNKKNNALYSLLSVLIFLFGLGFGLTSANAEVIDFIDFESYTHEQLLINVDFEADSPTPTGSSKEWQASDNTGTLGSGDRGAWSQRRSSDFSWDGIHYLLSEAVNDSEHYLTFDARIDYASNSSPGWIFAFRDSSDNLIFSVNGSINAGVGGINITSNGFSPDRVETDIVVVDNVWETVSLSWKYEDGSCWVRFVLPAETAWTEFTDSNYCWVGGGSVGELDRIFISGVGTGTGVMNAYFDNFTLGNSISGPQLPDFDLYTWQSWTYLGDNTREWNVTHTSGTDPHTLDVNFYYRNRNYSHVALKATRGNLTSGIEELLLSAVADLSTSETDFKLATFAPELSENQWCFWARLQNGIDFNSSGTPWRPIAGVCADVDNTLDIDETTGSSINALDSVECSFSAFAGCIIKVVSYLFIPDVEDATTFQNLPNLMANKFPFAYLYQIYDLVSNLSVAENEPIVIEFEAEDNAWGMQATIFSTVWISDIEGWSFIRSLMGAGIWLMLPVYLFSIIKRLRVAMQN